MRSCRRLQAIAVLFVVYTTDMKCTVYRIVGYIERGFKLAVLLRFLENLPNSILWVWASMGVFTSVDTPSPAEVLYLHVLYLLLQSIYCS